MEQLLVNNPVIQILIILIAVANAYFIYRDYALKKGHSLDNKAGWHQRVESDIQNLDQRMKKIEEDDYRDEKEQRQIIAKVQRHETDIAVLSTKLLNIENGIKEIKNLLKDKKGL